MNRNPLPAIQVHDSGHFLSISEGKPFFWLGDTAWELFHRLTIEEARQYFKNRREKRFTVIQAVALAEFDGLRTPNAYGELPFENHDPRRPNERYWRFVDQILRIANDEQLYIGLLPTWGDKVAELWGAGPIIFDVETAYLYGVWLGQRYRDVPNVIWILGGDRPTKYVSNQSSQPRDDTPVWAAMAAGLRQGAGERLLITYHPWGGHSSSEYVHHEPWLDFNMMQSGHGGGHDVPVWEMINHDYHLIPTKPTLDGEPNYEDHPVSPWPVWEPQTGYYDDYDVRKQIYRSVFSGGCGVTYGHHSVWQMASERYEMINHAKMYWQEALDRPGACQVRFLRTLIEARPFFSRIPDQAMLRNPGNQNREYSCATRDEDGRYGLVYLPVTQSVEVDLGKLNSGDILAWWYDPRTGKATLDGVYKSGNWQIFTPPNEGPDWVLGLDDVGAGFPIPNGS